MPIKIPNDLPASKILKEENNKRDEEIALLKERLDKLESIILKGVD